MKKILTGIVLLAVSGVAASATIYTNETIYLNALAELGYDTVNESFEDSTVWVRTPAVTTSTTSQGLVWASNYTSSTTGGLGGSVHDGAYGFFSNPHGNTTDGAFNCQPNETDFNDPCWQYDGWTVTSAESKTLYGVGGWIDDSGLAKVTFLLDGINVNTGRDGTLISGWTFVGVIDTAGFTTAEILELRGADNDQKLIFGDDFTVGVSAVPVPATAWLFGSGLIGLAGIARRKHVL